MDNSSRKIDLPDADLESVSGGGWSDITDWFKKKADSVPIPYKCETCGKVYTATQAEEAARYGTLGKHLCTSCRA